ncbi:MAG TPA: APC family permease [Pseudonocardiaceae bacterium]|nr:APC family permease [Pseudonocardiaceae bacterium]
MARTTRQSTVLAALATNRLGIFDVIMFALTAAAPLMVVGGVVTTGWAVTGTTGFPLAFLIVAVVLAVFCVGYMAMARRVTNAGAFYTYIARGASKTVGVGASFVAVVAYNLLQVGLYGAFGPIGSSLLQDKFGLSVPWWVCALVAWLFTAILGVLRVDVNSRVLAVLLVAEIVVVVVFDIVDLMHPLGGHVSVATLSPHSLAGPAVGTVLVTAITGYVGFEGAPVFSEESRDPRRTVPAATYLALAVMAVLYAGTSWAMSVTVGPDNVVKAAQQQSTDLIFNVAAAHLGNTAIVDIGHVLMLTSVAAAMLSYHNAVARYTFALGREGVLPRVLTRTGLRTGAPKVASAVQTAIGLAVIVVYAMTGLDPLVKLFFWTGMTGGLGVLILIAATSASVIGFFARKPDGESLWRRVVAPALAAIGLLVVLWLILSNYASLLGVAPTSSLRWVLPGLYAVAAVVGIVWAQILRVTKPGAYGSIGLGANAATGRTAAGEAPLGTATSLAR